LRADAWENVTAVLVLSFLHADAVVRTPLADLEFYIAAVIQAVCAQSQKLRNRQFKTVLFAK
jgi:hypothetical protein